jgi:hypothetical protein
MADLSLWEFADGATIEYSPAVLEELRRLAVEGFVAFGRGGLEVGGVLYGARHANRLTIGASAELACEHALGPGFVLSDKDHDALVRLLEPPPGLEAVGWYRAHTRRGLDLDATDRELFEQFFADEKSVGLVLKPTHWGPSAAAFYVRQRSGEIQPTDPHEFTIEPLRRKKPRESVASLPAPSPQSLAAPGTESLPALPVICTQPRASRPPDPPAGQPSRLKVLTAAVLLVAALAIYAWVRPPRKLALQAYGITQGQVRIEWNHNSLPVVDAASGSLQIRDGNFIQTIPLDANQLRSSSVVYKQKNRRVTVNLRVEPRHRGAAATEESIEFVGPSGPVLAQAASLIGTAARTTETASSAGQSASRSDDEDYSKAAELDVPTPTESSPSPSARDAPTRQFQPSFPPPKSSVSRVVLLPAAPLVPANVNLQSPLPDLFLRPELPPEPITQPYTGPRSGRLIWTGDLGRHGVVEIEGAHASIGSLSGSISPMPADYQAFPAEFVRDGLALYTMEGAAHGRSEPPSKSNGWNSVHFVFDPVRVGELVVLERPSSINSFNRLVLRNDARNCRVIVVDWILRSDLRN